MSRTLYEISGDLYAIEQLLTANEGEIPEDEIGARIEQWFEALSAERDEKIDGYCAMIKEIEARQAARECEAERLLELAEIDAAAAALRLKMRLKAFFDLHKIAKLETTHFKLSVAQNGGALPLNLPDGWEAEPASAPEAFQRRKIELDKAAIREAIRNDGETHGATMAARGTHLRIR